jgi:hypothetical protein
LRHAQHPEVQVVAAFALTIVDRRGAHR